MTRKRAAEHARKAARPDGALRVAISAGLLLVLILAALAH